MSLVDKQSAINAIKNLPLWIMDSNGEFQPVDPPTVSMIDPGDAVSAIENLPIHQENIHCYECIYGTHSGCGDSYLCNVSPELVSEHGGDFFCGYAKRRRDEFLN